MKFYSDQRLGLKTSLTPEGFLLCEDVPISRIGELMYVEGEIPLDAGPDGVIRVERHPEDVFSPESMASFAGKPVTNDHPDEEVTPENWKLYAVGTVQNPRPGEGPLSGCLVGDLLITDKDAIEDVRAGKREVSCGYDAEYEQVAPGRGVQRQIVGNHVALVERGRCGPRCSISDKRGEVMTVTKKQTMAERLISALKGVTNDEEAGGVHLHIGGGDNEPTEKEKAFDEYIKSCDKRFGDLETGIKGLTDAFTAMTKKEGEEAGDPDTSDEEGTEEEKKAKANDSFKEVLARAEILAPGLSFSMPTFDAKKPKSLKAFSDALCSCKRQALTAAMKTEDGKKAVQRFIGAYSVDATPAVLIDAAFIGASELMRDKNNAGAGRAAVVTRDFGKAPKSVADVNEANRKFWAGRA